MGDERFERDELDERDGPSGEADATVGDDDVPAEYLMPRGKPITPSWFAELPESAPMRYEAGRYPLWRVLVAAAFALFALANLASFVSKVGGQRGNPFVSLDVLVLGVLVGGCGAAIWWLLRRR